MDARFAGSARLGERRRRRLAVESDEAADASDSPNAAQELPAAAGAVRFLESSNVLGGSAIQPFYDVAIPATRIIPTQLWKHVLFGFLAFSIAGGLIATALLESAQACASFWGLEKLVCLPEARLATWVSGGMLLLAAQVALLIRWGRSRSLKDFDGRYRVWNKASAGFVVMACSVSTGAHHVWAKLVARQISARFQYPEDVNWLAPALLIGLWLASSLAREMKRCRSSLIIFSGAVFCYTVCTTCLLGLWKLTDWWSLDRILLAGSLMGHVCLLISLVLNARHVLYFCADPTQSKRRKLRIPRPHFRWPQWARRHKSAAADDLPKSTAGNRRKRRRKDEPAEVATEMPEPMTQSKRDQTHKETETRGESSVPQRPAADVQAARHEMPPVSKSGANHAAPKAAATTPEPARSASSVAVERNVQPSAARYEDSQAESRRDESDDEGNDDYADTDSASGSKPDFRGMSKKQRRRLMQEMRDRERSQRR